VYENEVIYVYLAVKFCCIHVLMYNAGTWTRSRQILEDKSSEGEIFRGKKASTKRARIIKK
jgi:hypothetical protein